MEPMGIDRTIPEPVVGKELFPTPLVPFESYPRSLALMEPVWGSMYGICTYGVMGLGNYRVVNSQ